MPAKKIGCFDKFINKRLQKEQEGEIPTVARNQELTAEEIRNAWNIFEKQRV